MLAPKGEQEGAELLIDTEGHGKSPLTLNLTLLEFKLRLQEKI
jgi:hypothetical protein